MRTDDPAFYVRPRAVQEPPAKVDPTRLLRKGLRIAGFALILVAILLIQFHGSLIDIGIGLAGMAVVYSIVWLVQVAYRSFRHWMRL